MGTILQFTAGFAKGDAISNEALIFRDIFRSWGYSSEILSETKRILPELRKQARDALEYRSSCRPDDLAILHLSIGSVVNDVFAELPCRKAILFHNITPPDFFSEIQPQMAHSLAKGWSQARSLAGIADVTLADSRFNAAELEKVGHKDVKVLPIVLNLAMLRGSPERTVLRRFGDGMVNVLFVGRCAPNKKIEDVITAFSFFQKTVEPNSRLILVGSAAGLERYYYFLFSMAHEMNLRNVYFARAVTQAQLNAFYRRAHIFLCMSEHEGFCVPIIESMLHNVPVMAYAAGAVPETLDGAGVLFREKRYDMIAEMAARLARDSIFRTAVLRKQQERVARYEARDFSAELRQHLAPLLSR